MRDRELGPVDRCLDALLAGAVRAAEEGPIRLDSMTDDPAAAVIAGRCEGVDGALERVEGVALGAQSHLERLVVFVAADLTDSHERLLPAGQTRKLAAPETQFSWVISGY